MIQDTRQIEINSPPEKVFSLIETMPNKFPVYGILETKAFLFLRLLLVNGLRTAIEMIKIDKLADTAVMQVGDSMGPFELKEVEKPFKYLFTLQSFFFNCKTGYTLSAKNNGTRLDFVLIANNPRLIEKLYWFFVKPIHLILAKKVLKVIKDKIELRSIIKG